MPRIDLDKVIDEFIYDGFFSEYLPPLFSLRNNDIDLLQIPLRDKIDLIDPLSFNMSRFTEDGKRRIISIPEFSSYITTVKYIKNNNIIRDLLLLSRSKHSFSPLLQKNGEMTRHEKNYNFGITLNEADQETVKSTYIPNVIDKIRRAKGAKGILSLDIANFYASIYTHIIPAIKLGYDTAEELYKISKKDNTDARITDEYRVYVKLDEHIRNLNGARTNGLLSGILISQFIAETLLSIIDKEIESQNINFARYVDDYEIFIYDEKDIPKIQNTISEILNKYFLTLNNEKTKYTKFPYYVIENLEKIYSDYIENGLSKTEMIKLFNTYFEMESSGIKGAIRFLVKSLNNSFVCSDINLYTAYLLNILVNDSRSLVKVCELIINQRENLIITNQDIEIIEQLLIQQLEMNNHLETIWLLYLRKRISNKRLQAKIIHSVINSKNDIAIVILIEEFMSVLTNNMKNKIVNNASSWLLCYQLFLHDMIDKETFSRKSGIKQNINFYTQLKRKRFTFYRK